MIDMPAPYLPRPEQWNVLVTSDGVTGCTGSYRWRWRARMRAHRDSLRWPGEKTIAIEFGVPS